MGGREREREKYDSGDRHACGNSFLLYNNTWPKCMVHCASAW